MREGYPLPREARNNNNNNNNNNNIYLNYLQIYKSKHSTNEKHYMRQKSIRYTNQNYMTKCKVILDKRMGCRSPNTKVLSYPYIEDTHNTNMEHSEDQVHEDGVKN